jgi:hypothetical protein
VVRRARSTGVGVTASSARMLREDLATATRILARHEMVGMFGHVSVMTDGPQRDLICRARARARTSPVRNDVLELDLGQEFKPGLPLELYIVRKISGSASCERKIVFA